MELLSSKTVRTTGGVVVAAVGTMIVVGAVFSDFDGATTASSSSEPRPQLVVTQDGDTVPGTPDPVVGTDPPPSSNDPATVGNRLREQQVATTPEPTQTVGQDPIVVVVAHAPLLGNGVDARVVTPDGATESVETNADELGSLAEEQPAGANAAGSDPSTVSETEHTGGDSRRRSHRHRGRRARTHLGCHPLIRAARLSW